MVLENHHSTESKVLSGVPQGTVLGPLCFLLYVNNMGSNISSHLELFADDTLLYAVIDNQADALSLQSDLNKLVLVANEISSLQMLRVANQ